MVLSTTTAGIESFPNLEPPRVPVLGYTDGESNESSHKSRNISVFALVAPTGGMTCQRAIGKFRLPCCPRVHSLSVSRIIYIYSLCLFLNGDNLTLAGIIMSLEIFAGEEAVFGETEYVLQDDSTNLKVASTSHSERRAVNRHRRQLIFLRTTTWSMPITCSL